MTTPNTYQAKAHATQSRRRARGLYKRPTKAQTAAWNKLMQSRRLYGEPVYTQEDCVALSTHPFLAEATRQEFAAMAAACARLSDIALADSGTGVAQGWRNEDVAEL